MNLASVPKTKGMNGEVIKPTIRISPEKLLMLISLTTYSKQERIVDVSRDILYEIKHIAINDNEDGKPQLEVEFMIVDVYARKLKAECKLQRKEWLLSEIDLLEFSDIQEAAILYERLQMPISELRDKIEALSLTCQIHKHA